MTAFLDKASEAVRQVGGRMTSQRRLIVELLEAAPARLDANGLYDLARRQDTTISLATVYRTLNALEDAGLIRQQYISASHDRKYYEPAAETYHFTCRICHRVLTFTSPLIPELRRQLEIEFHVQTLNACVCVDGVCPDCQAREARSEL